MQKILSAEQIEAFFHNNFVEDQVSHFVTLCGEHGEMKCVIDMGGGCGFFAKQLNDAAGYNVKVIDMDQASVDACHRVGIDAIQGDALNPKISGNENIVSFNLILHHLVTGTDRDTLALQIKALAVWKTHSQYLFINEYIYESYIGNISGWVIYQITKNPTLSWIGGVVSRAVPSLKANTFGVGVRFRASKEWQEVFAAAGYVVKATVVGQKENVSFPRRLLLIKNISRDSFLLEPCT